MCHVLLLFPEKSENQDQADCCRGQKFTGQKVPHWPKFQNPNLKAETLF